LGTAGYVCAVERENDILELRMADGGRVSLTRTEWEDLPRVKELRERVCSVEAVQYHIKRIESSAEEKGRWEGMASAVELLLEKAGKAYGTKQDEAAARLRKASDAVEAKRLGEMSRRMAAQEEQSETSWEAIWKLLGVDDG